MKTTLTIVFLTLLLAFSLPAQDQPAPQPTVTQSAPQFAITIGGGFSQYTNPSRTLTGSFLMRLKDGTYEATSVDQGMKLNPDTGKREPISTIRTGIQQLLHRQGPIGLWVTGDIGLVTGAGNLTGAGSAGGTMTYELPQRVKMPGLFVYAGVRILKAPQPATNDPATVQTAFSFGLGWHSDR